MRSKPRGGPAAAALALLGAGLAGCSTISSWMPFSSSKTAAPAAASCPSAVILQPLRQTAVFAPGAEHQPLGVAFYGILDDVTSKCDRTGDAVRLSLDVVVIGERGPAGAAVTSLDLQYFVAVTGPGQTILSKRSLPVRIALPTGERRAGITDHIVESIPLGGRAPGDLSVVLGFQQSPDAVEFYKHFRGR